MLWYIDGTRDQLMVVNEEFTKDEQLVADIVGVIRLRGGALGYYHQARVNKFRTGRSRGLRLLIPLAKKVMSIKQAAALAEKTDAGDPGPPGSQKTCIPKTLLKVQVGGMGGKKMRGVFRMLREMKEGTIYYTMNWYVSSVNCPVATLTPTSNFILSGSANYWWKCSTGTGPPLYSETFVGDTIGQNATYMPWKTFGSIAFPGYTSGGISATYDGVLDTTFNAAGLPWNASILNFSANYPFQTMLPFTTTQNLAKKECYLNWYEETSQPTTDPFFPVPYSTVIGNKDWTKIVCMGTQYKMTFTNYSPCEQMVEVLFYKIIPDIDAFNSVGALCNLVTNQTTFMEEYCRGDNRVFGVPQYSVIQRDRFLMKPQQNPTVLNGLYQWSVNNSRHVVEKTYTIKQKYSIERPITNTGTTPLEAVFYNTYYDHQNSIYCRIQTWQTDGMMTIQANIDATLATGVVTTARTQSQINAYMPYSYSKNQTTGVTSPIFGIPDNPKTTQTVRPFVNLLMQKRTWLFLDTPMLKGPFVP